MNTLDAFTVRVRGARGQAVLQILDVLLDCEREATRTTLQRFVHGKALGVRLRGGGDAVRTAKVGAQAWLRSTHGAGVGYPKQAMATVVSVREVADALEMAFDEISNFVNTATGEVRTVTHEFLALAERDADPAAPGWQREAIEQAKQVLDSPDWLELPTKFEIHEWQLMDEFTEALPDDRARTELRDSLRGKGAFRYFKDSLRRLDLQDAWFAYKRRALEDMASAWLADHGLQAGDSPRA